MNRHAIPSDNTETARPILSFCYALTTYVFWDQKLSYVDIAYRCAKQLGTWYLWWQANCRRAIVSEHSSIRTQWIFDCIFLDCNNAIRPVTYWHVDTKLLHSSFFWCFSGLYQSFFQGFLLLLLFCWFLLVIDLTSLKPDEVGSW